MMLNLLRVQMALVALLAGGGQNVVMDRPRTGEDFAFIRID